MKSCNRLLTKWSVMKAKDYIEIDSTLETNDILDDNEIIAAVQEAPEDMTTTMRFLQSGFRKHSNLYNYL